MRALCVGLMICDISLFPVPRTIFELDQSDIETPSMTGGGDAFNVAAVLGRLGESASLIGRVGSDSHAKLLLDYAKKCTVDTSCVQFDQRFSTAVSYILIDDTGERHFLCDSKINDVLDEPDIPEQELKKADLIFFGSALAMDQMDRGGLCKLFCKAKQLGKTTILDASVTSDHPGSLQMERLQSTLAYTDIFFPSYEEAAYLTGKSSLNEIVELFHAFPIRIFGIKLGKHGCYVTDFKKQYRIGCFPSTVIDTTGAGDCFMGGFIRGLLHRQSLKDCALMGSAAAAHGIGQIGATEGIPSGLQLDAYMKAHAHVPTVYENAYGEEINLC